ncbi:hypothetical protein BH20ACI4_BH20ACI4_33670 [soil metagenome]
MLAACGNSVSETANVNQNYVNNMSDDSVQTDQKMNDNYLIKMSRSACFGNCPAYNLTIYENGKVIFEGVKFTKIKEKEEINLDEEKINALIGEIEKADFYSFKDIYDGKSGNCPAFWFDSPNVVISIKLREKEKTILHNLGCEEKSKVITSVKVFPSQLYNLENKIDEIVETKRWIGEGK